MKYHLNGTWVNDETITELPEGATALTDAQWENRHSQPYVPTLAETVVNAIKKIDADTDALIGAVIGNRASEYERAEAQAAAFVAAGYSGPVPSFVQSWADAKVAQGWPAQMAADDILATANAWRPAQEAIRAQRLLRKEQVRAAADASAVNTVLAKWGGFLAGIRAQLGV